MAQNGTLPSKMVYQITNKTTKVSCKVVSDQLGVSCHDGAIRFSIQIDLQLQLEVRKRYSNDTYVKIIHFYLKRHARWTTRWKNWV